MQIREIHGEHLRRIHIIKKITTLLSERRLEDNSWQQWPQPFLDWATVYVNDPNTIKNYVCLIEHLKSMVFNDLQKGHDEHLRRIQIITTITRLLSERQPENNSWQQWPEPFLDWATVYVNDPNTKKDYGCLIEHLKSMVFEDLQKGLDVWIKEAVEQKLIDVHYQGEDKNPDELVCKILTSFIYDSKRQTLPSEDFKNRCVSIYFFLFLVGWVYHKHEEVNLFLNDIKQHFLNIINDSGRPQSSVAELEKLLSQKESIMGTYFGSYLSDDSDSDEEQDGIRDPEARDYRNFIAEQHVHRLEEYLPTIANKSALYKPMTKEKKLGLDAAPLWRINRANLTQQQHRDLSRLNQLIEEGKSISDATKQITTKFVVAQYRGIAYSVSAWNQTARRNHRDKKNNDEVSQPQFSASVHKVAGAYPFSKFFNLTPTERQQYQNALRQNAVALEKKLLDSRSIQPALICTSPGSYYILRSLAYALQSIYTVNYNGFHDMIAKEPRPSILINDQNPFISTGNVPKHALGYAYGSKYYGSAEDSRLRPRWRSGGRAERPYSGKVYVSLHCIDSYNDQGPFDIPCLFSKGELAPIINNILHERETTFPAWLREELVVLQHIAKYPSFHKEYKKIYLYKYGLTEPLYNLFRAAIIDIEHKPHGKESKHYKMLLANWLACYQEVRLIDEARRIAEEKGAVLVYHNQDGSFGFEPDSSKIIGTAPGDENIQSRTQHAEIVIFRRQLATSASSCFNVAELKKYFQQNPCGIIELGPNCIARLEAVSPKSELARLFFSSVSHEPKIIQDDPILDSALEKKSSTFSPISKPETDKIMSQLLTQLSPYKKSVMDELAGSGRIVDVLGDGNCFFYAVSQEFNRLSSSTMTHVKLRADAVKYLEDNHSLTTYPPEGETSEEYLTRMKLDKTYAEGAIINATAKVLNVHFIVAHIPINERTGQETGGLSFLHINDATGRLTIGLILRGQHYMILELPTATLSSEQEFFSAPVRSNVIAASPSRATCECATQTSPLATASSSPISFFAHTEPPSVTAVMTPDIRLSTVPAVNGDIMPTETSIKDVASASKP